MTEPQRKPSRREILKPLEYLVISAIFGTFTGLVVLLSTRQPMLALIGFGIAFIAGLVGIALFALSVPIDEFERKDLDDQNDSIGGNPH